MGIGKHSTPKLQALALKSSVRSFNIYVKMAEGYTCHLSYLEEDQLNSKVQD